MTVTALSAPTPCAQNIRYWMPMHAYEVSQLERLYSPFLPAPRDGC